MITSIVKWFQTWAIYLLLGVIAGLGVFAGIQTYRLLRLQLTVEKDRTAAATELAKAKEDLRVAQEGISNSLNAVSAAYERGKQDGAQYQGSILDAFSSGDIKLQPRWQCPTVARVPASTGSPGESESAKREREESAARAIAAAHDCDLQNASLLMAYKAVQKSIDDYIKKASLR